MTIPDWRTSSAGARIRVALWLRSEVGEGGAFTKAQLRQTFPNVEQVDRRMRDLRAEGWVIATYREDRSLTVDELRLVQVGGPVWERGYRSRQASVTDKERRAVFAADGYACVYCGIIGGDAYPDDAIRTAKLTLGRVGAAREGKPQLITVCDRCHVASRHDSTQEEVLEAIEGLAAEERQELSSWVARGKKRQSALERIWAQYRRLPHDSRSAVRAVLEVD